MSINEVCTNSKKVKAFIVMAMAVIIAVVAFTLVNAPPNVAMNALWIIGFGGLATIGGQSLIDSIEKWSVIHTNKPADPPAQPAQP